LWTLIKILLIIFVITACFTSNLVKDDPDQMIVAVIIWVVVIAGIIVFFMAVSYWGGKNPPPTPYAPVYQQSAYGQQVPGNNPYQAYAQPAPGIRICRYCDSYLSPQSPICPRCGRKN
jgi:quinol-cytochrome oxidoreductase complex cytochrome b subunit